MTGTSGAGAENTLLRSILCGLRNLKPARDAKDIAAETRLEHRDGQRVACIYLCGTLLASRSYAMLNDWHEILVGAVEAGGIATGVDRGNSTKRRHIMEELDCSAAPASGTAIDLQEADQSLL